MNHFALFEFALFTRFLQLRSQLCTDERIGRRKASLDFYQIWNDLSWEETFEEKERLTTGGVGCNFLFLTIPNFASEHDPQRLEISQQKL